MRRAFLQTLAGNSVLMLLSLVIGGLSARLLGVQGRGEFAAIQLLPHLTFVIAVMGLHEAIVYQVAQGRFPPGIVFGSALAITAPLALGGFIASFALAPLVLHKYGPAIIGASRLYSLFIVIALVHGVAMRLLQGGGRFGWWNAFRVILQAGSLVVLIALWGLGALSPETYAIGILILTTLVLVATLGVLRTLGVHELRASRDCVRALWSYAWRAGTGTIPQLLNARVDQLLIAVALSATDLGLYATAASWSWGFQPVAAAYSSALFPDIARDTADQPSQRFTKGLRHGLALLTLCWAGYLLVTPVAFRFVFGQPFAVALPTVEVLVVAALFLAVNEVLDGGLKGLGQPLLVGVSQVVGLVITATLLFLLVPRYGIFGAGLASLGAYLVTTALLLAGVRRCVRCRWRELLILNTEEWAKVVLHIREWRARAVGWVSG